MCVFVLSAADTVTHPRLRRLPVSWRRPQPPSCFSPGAQVQGCSCKKPVSFQPSAHNMQTSPGFEERMRIEGARSSSVGHQRALCVAHRIPHISSLNNDQFFH